MTYADLRTLVKQHFEKQLDKAKSRIMNNGRLAPEDLQGYEGNVRTGESAIKLDQTLSLLDSDADLLSSFITQYELDIQPESPKQKQLLELLRIGFRDYSKAVLNFDEQLAGMDFTAAAVQAPSTYVETKTPAGLSIRELVEAYSSEKKLAQRWASKTEMEKADHMALLMEILGADLPAAKVGALQAKQVKDVITKYPRNRNKNPATRGKPLADVVGMANVETISLPSMNKYLQSYNDLFEWGSKQGHVPDNRFSGLTIQQRRDGQKGQRDAFSNKNICLMLDVLTGKRLDLISVKLPYQKWGSLIGIYTGARLNEICQLETSDIRQQDGIWCIDINAEGDRKHLKTAASKRLVPLHPKLLELGFLDYVTERKNQKAAKLFSGFSYSPQNGWGRNLGRWFNERFLTALELKTKENTFHSLRHTINTRLLHANVVEPLVKSIIGHEQEGMTYKQYFGEGFTLEQRYEALQKLDYGWTDTAN